MTSVRNQLIAEYMQRLDTASTFLSAGRRTELRQEIREHIDAAMDEVETLDADAVRGILERLGPPAEIVAAELGTRATSSIPIPVVREEAAAEAEKTRNAAVRETEVRETEVRETEVRAMAAPPTIPDAAGTPRPGPTPPRAGWSGRRTLLVGGLAAAVVLVGSFTVIGTSDQNVGPATRTPGGLSSTPTPPVHETPAEPPPGTDAPPSAFPGDPTDPTASADPTNTPGTTEPPEALAPSPSFSPTAPPRP